MLEHVILKRSGELEYHNQHDAFIVDDDIVLPCLNFITHLEKGVSLRSLFRMFARYPTLTALDTWIPHYMEDIKALPEIGCRKNFDGLVVQRRIEATDKSKTPKTVFDPPEEDGSRRMRVEYVEGAFSALSHYVSLSGRREGDPERYSLSMTPLNEIFDVPLELGGCEMFVFGDDDYQQMVFDEAMTLNEIVMAIIHEISFFGTDEQKDQEFKALEALVEKNDKARKKADPFTVIKGGKDD